MIITTGNDVAGHTVAQYLGVVRGIVVRSPNIAQGFLGGLQQIMGGNIEPYAGSTRCAECHAAHYRDWKDSAHNKMIRPPVAQGPNRTVLADFSQPSPHRTFELKDVKYVIGHRWKQRFIGEVNGQEVVFPA